MWTGSLNGGPGMEWKKVNGRWVPTIQEDSTFALPSPAAFPNHPALQPRDKWSKNKRNSDRVNHNNGNDSLQRRNERFMQTVQEDQWQPVLRHVMGTGTLRRITCSLSEGIKFLQLDSYAFNQRGFLYCAEFYTLLLEKYISNLSGYTQIHMFQMIEKMVDQAIKSELNIPVVREMMRVAALAVHSSQKEVIGSRSLWKKHQEKVNNSLVRLQKFQFTEREDDGAPCLMDMPKEALHKIFSHLSDPADIVHLGQTCSYLNDISTDPFIWKGMALFHFTEKQLLPFIGQEEFYDLEWLHIFKQCKKKHKALKKIYGDELVSCSNCRGLHWQIAGHECSSILDTPPVSTPVSPQQLVELFRL